MGLFGVMRSGVSGMNAQSSKLGTVAENIMNSSTTGYKRAKSEFSSLVVSQGAGSFNSGGVEAHTQYEITKKGNLSFTTSKLDLAIDGNGFFVVGLQDDPRMPEPWQWAGQRGSLSILPVGLMLLRRRSRNRGSPA